MLGSQTMLVKGGLVVVGLGFLVIHILQDCFIGPEAIVPRTFIRLSYERCLNTIPKQSNERGLIHRGVLYVNLFISVLISSVMSYSSYEELCKQLVVYPLIMLRSICHFVRCQTDAYTFTADQYLWKDWKLLVKNGIRRTRYGTFY